MHDPDAAPMSAVLLENIRALLDAPEPPPPNPPAWRHIVRALLDEVDLRGAEIVRLQAEVDRLNGVDTLLLAAPSTKTPPTTSGGASEC